MTSVSITVTKETTEGHAAKAKVNMDDDSSPDDRCLTQILSHFKETMCFFSYLLKNAGILRTQMLPFGIRQTGFYTHKAVRKILIFRNNTLQVNLP